MIILKKTVKNNYNFVLLCYLLFVSLYQSLKHKTTIKIKVMKNYLVISIEDINDNYEVNDLDELIKDMYSQELVSNSFETVKKWFFNNYHVYESESEIKMLQVTDY